MFKHIVAWKLKDFAEGASKEENAQIAKAKLEGLQDKIKEIRFIEVGINVNDAADAYDIVLYSEFDSLEDFQHYRNHPEHLKAGDFISRVRLEGQVIDYHSG